MQVYTQCTHINSLGPTYQQLINYQYSFNNHCVKFSCYHVKIVKCLLYLIRAPHVTILCQAFVEMQHTK